MLIHLLSDFARNEDLRHRFQSDPHSVLKDYNITPAEQRRLKRGGADALKALLQENAQALYSPYAVMMPWPPPTGDVTVSSITPASGAAGNSVPVTVRGSGFHSGADFGLHNPSIQVHAEQVEVSVDGKSIRGILSLPSSAGVYDVVVRNTDNTSGELTQGFTVNT